MIAASFKHLFLFLIPFLALSVQADSFTSPFGLKFVKIPAGDFIMGNENFDDLAREVKPERLEQLKKELPPHKVTISSEFYMASTETTQLMWKTIMGLEPGKESRWENPQWASLPVSRVSWLDVQSFIKEINEMDDEYIYRLPTEAEWEYAARAGTSGLRPFAFEQMADYAWYRKTTKKSPMPVASLKPNHWGLYDMLGNLWEWVADSYDAEYYKQSVSIDPRGPASSIRKVMRGGSYHCTTERVRVGIRGSYLDSRSLSVLGFRLAANKKTKP